MAKNQEQTRGLRNNNPGNIERTKDKWQGMSATQLDTRFVTFDSIEYGYRAIFRNIHTFYTKYKLTSIRGIISRWAPPIENHTENYIARVAKNANYPANVTISLQDRELMCKIVESMDIVENSLPNSPRRPNMDKIVKGYNLAFPEWAKQ